MACGCVTSVSASLSPGLLPSLCVFTRSSYKEPVMDSGSILLQCDLIFTNHICQDPISKYGHIPRFQTVTHPGGCYSIRCSYWWQIGLYASGAGPPNGSVHLLTPRAAWWRVTERSGPSGILDPRGQGLSVCTAREVVPRLASWRAALWVFIHQLVTGRWLREALGYHQRGNRALSGPPGVHRGHRGERVWLL